MGAGSCPLESVTSPDRSASESYVILERRARLFSRDFHSTLGLQTCRGVV